MKKISYWIVVIIALTGCTKDYDVMITDVNFHPIKEYDDFSEETEFLSRELLFGAELKVDPSHGSGSLFGARVGEVTCVNPVLPDRLTLTSNQDVVLEDRTIPAGENLIELFDYKMLQHMFLFSCHFRSKTRWYNDDGYYTFYFKAQLANNQAVSDSCLVKINF